MRGDGRTPRGLRAPQTSSHAAGGTTRSVAPNHGRRAIEKKADPSSDIRKANKIQAPTPLRPADPPRSSVAPTKKPSNIGRNYQHHFQHSPNQLHQPNLSLENKTAGEQSTDSQKGSQIRRSKGGDKFPTSCSKERKGNTDTVQRVNN